MRLLLPLLAVVALAKKPKHAPAVRAVPDPVLPSGDAAAVAAPRLTGHAAVLALDGLDRDRYSFTFDADTSALAGLDDAGVDAVFAALAADPAWRVTRDAGARVAWLRAEDTVGPDGWHTVPGGCWRVGVREARAIEPDWAASEHVVRVPAGTARIALRGFRPDGPACAAIATALRVEGALAVEIFEAGPADARPVTTEALGAVPRAVADATTAAATVLASGFDALALPDGEPARIERPTVTVGPAGAGAVAVAARVNAGEPGWAWVRVLAGGVPWEEARLGPATLEQPGWSGDPSQGFALRAVAPVPPGPAFDGVAEVWFQGADGRVRRLCAGSVTVPTR